MAKKLTKERATAIAVQYMTNGFDKGKALRACAYSKAYSITTRGLELFDNELVKAEMAAIAARNAALADVKVEEIIQGFRKKAFPAEGDKVLDRDNLSALGYLAKYRGMLKDTVVFETAEAKKLGKGLAKKMLSL